jgi:hypothetical protein
VKPSEGINDSGLQRKMRNTNDRAKLPSGTSLNHARASSSKSGCLEPGFDAYQSEFAKSMYVDNEIISLISIHRSFPVGRKFH